MSKYKIFHFSSLPSTQDKAKEFAKKGFSNIIIAADKQTKGRGRFKREWHSDNGGLWMSILLKPKNSENLQYLTFAAAIAAAESIKKIAGLNAKIKWPNDVHHNGRKLCGILTEGIFGRENYAIVGIGININQKKFTDEIKNTATSLSIITGKNFDKNIFLKSLAKKFIILYEALYSKNKFGSILKLWKMHCDTIGMDVTALTKTEALSGKAIGVDNECRLLLRLNNGRIRKIIEGDVTLNPLN